MNIYNGYLANYQRTTETAKALRAVKRNQSTIVDWILRLKNLIAVNKQWQHVAKSKTQATAIAVRRLKKGDVLLLNGGRKGQVTEILFHEPTEKIRLTLLLGEEKRTVEYHQNGFVLLLRQEQAA
jgi:preprotein translocase subunit YajC